MSHVEIPVSTVPQVKRYLAEQITNACIGRTVPGYALLIAYDPPGRYRPDDIITIGRVWNRMANPFKMVGSGGRGYLKEDYELEITVDVKRSGESLNVTAYERAWELMSIVESVVREDPSLGGRVIVARPANSTDSSYWEKDHKGYIVSVVTRILIQAEI